LLSQERTSLPHGFFGSPVSHECVAVQQLKTPMTQPDCVMHLVAAEKVACFPKGNLNEGSGNSRDRGILRKFKLGAFCGNLSNQSFLFLYFFSFSSSIRILGSGFLHAKITEA
jgi:hypothetical protein